MAYADLLDIEGIASQYIVVVKPRRLVDSTLWSNVSGTRYVQNFSFGQVSACMRNDTVLDEASSTSVSDGDWFYEESSGDLYVDIGVNPAGSDIIATYEIYLGTFDAHFNRVPFDSASRVVYYEPLITKSPDVIASNTDLLFGFLPSNSTTISISNTTQFLQEHLYESSFNRCEIEVYHWLDELSTANLKLVTKGICGSITSDDIEVSIVIYDNNDLFNAEFRHVDGESFYSTTDFPNLDPFYESRPIRKVYGVVDGFIPVNVQYDLSNGSILNRTWVCIKQDTNLASISTTVPLAAVSTTTRTYLTSASGFRIGDNAYIESLSGHPSDASVIVTNVNNTVAPYYIEHDINPNVAGPGDNVYRSFVGSITLVKDGVTYPLLFGFDWQEYTDPTNGVAGFELYSFESRLSIDKLTPGDLVYCRVYGNKSTVTMSGSPFGVDSTVTINQTNGIQIFFELLKDYLGIPESSIDLTGITALYGNVDDEMGFAIPTFSQSQFPSFKDLFTDLSQSMLLKFFINDDNKFSIVQTGPAGSISKTIEDDEILESTFKYNFDYADIRSDIFVEYSGREVSPRNETGSLFSSVVTRSNSLARRLHQIKKQETYHSLHFIKTQAARLAERLSYALGDRRGRISFTTKNRFFDSEINEVINVTRTKLPGYAYDGDTTRTRNGVTISTQKSLDRIVIEMDDQKGIEDNSAAW